MLWGALACFIRAVFMSGLVALGIWHAHRTEAEEPMLKSKAVPAAS
jgi:hypothetical protein